MSSPGSPYTGDEQRILSAVPNADAQEGATEAQHPSPAKGDDGEERVSKLFLVALLALLVLGVALIIQSQRVETFQSQVSDLSGQVAALEEQLAGAEARVERFELEREQIRLSVGNLREDLLALEALVATHPSLPSPAAPPAAPAPDVLP